MVLDLRNVLEERLHPSIQELQDIWTSIGYDEAEQQEKCELLAQRLQQVFYLLVREESEFRLRLDREIDEKRREVNEWAHVVGKPAFFPPRDLSSYHLLRVLKDKVNEYKCEEQTRKRDFVTAFKQIQAFLVQLGLEKQPEVAIPSWPQIQAMRQRYTPKKVLEPPSPTQADSGASPALYSSPMPIPTEADLQRLREALSTLQEKHGMQWKRFRSLRDDLRRISQDVQYFPQTHFESAVLRAESPTLGSTPQDKGPNENNDISLLDIEDTATSPTDTSESSPPPVALLTTESLQSMEEWRQKLVKQKAMLMGSCEELRSHLRTLWTRLAVPEEFQNHFLEKHSGYKPSDLEGLQEEQDRCQQLKWEHLEDYVAGLQRELAQYCNLCLADPPAAATSGDTSREQEVAHLEKAVEQMRTQYESHKVLYDTVGQYQRLWEQYMQVELKMKDPAILSNRGGILLKTEKEKKRLLKELPRVEQEVQSQLDNMLQSHSARGGSHTFTLRDGLTFAEYVSQLWREFQKDRDTNKFRRTRGASGMLSGGSGQSLNASNPGVNETPETGGSPAMRRPQGSVTNSSQDSNSLVNRRISYTKTT